MWSVAFFLASLSPVWARVGFQWSTLTGCRSGDIQSRSVCDSMAEMGYCSEDSSYFAFVSRSCCSTCSRHTTVVAKPAPKCVDSMWQCGGWAKQGYCESTSQKWIQDRCCKSCSAATAARDARFGKKRPAEHPAPRASPARTTSRRSKSKAAPRRSRPSSKAAPRTSSRTASRSRPTPRASRSRPSPKAAPARKSSSRSNVITVHTPAACADRNSSCTAWSKAGFCDTNTLVRNDCCKSCSAPTAVALNSCVDIESAVKCRAWRGFCGTRRTVGALCKATCGLCGQQKLTNLTQTKSMPSIASLPRYANLRLAKDPASTVIIPEIREGCKDTTTPVWCDDTAIPQGFCQSQWKVRNRYCCRSCECHKHCESSGDPSACMESCRS